MIYNEPKNLQEVINELGKEIDELEKEISLKNQTLSKLIVIKLWLRKIKDNGE
jgi:peptidoglycan hydrolase CwlO-like protein